MIAILVHNPARFQQKNGKQQRMRLRIQTSRIR